MKLKQKKLMSVFKNEKNREIVMNVSGTMLVKGASLIISLMTFPAYIRFFQNQVVLGVWYTMIAVLAWIMTFDFGIGNGLRNKLTVTFVEKDTVKAKKYVSSAYLLIGVAAVIISIIAGFVFQWVNWNGFFNVGVDIISSKILSKTMMIIFVGIMIQFWLKLINSIFYAMQKSALPNFLSLCSSILLLLALYLLKSDSLEKNLQVLAYANIITLNLPMLCASVFVFSKKLKFCRPNIRCFDKKIAKGIFALGGVFFWLQLMAVIISNTNEFLITWFLGPSHVVEYQIYFRIFSIGNMIAGLVLTPIWSSITKAKTQKDQYWLNRLFKVLIFLYFIAIICEIALAFLFPFIEKIWLGSNFIEPNSLYLTVFVVTSSLNILATILTSYANGLNELKVELVFLTLGAFANIPLAGLLAHTTGSWISIVIANAISLAPYCLVQPFFIKKYLNKI